jgi:predicted GH43/DUF377 family glycosyl hydrolase
MSIDQRVQEQAGYFTLVYGPPGRYVNDHCITRGPDDLWHLFHIVGPVGKGYRDSDSEIAFGHATSADLCTWREQPDVLAIDPTSKHQPDHIFAPYVERNGSTYYMYYAGINMNLKNQSICLACSEDLYIWNEHPYNPVFRPSRYWAEWEPQGDAWSSCRDPHILLSSRYGYILYYTACTRGAEMSAIGCALSDNLISWQDGGPVLIRKRETGHYTHWTESPCVIEQNGLYYLFYTHGDGTRLVISDDPLRFGDKEDRWFSVAHASEVFETGGQWYISSCSREPWDVEHVSSDRARGLYMTRLEWDGTRPRVAPLETEPDSE